MYRRLARRLTPHTLVALTISIALLSLPGVSLLISGSAQGQHEERRAKPKPGKPEGELPDLEDVKNESSIEREAPPPIPSTVRSKKNPLQPWDGRRVGDPGTQGALDHNRTQRGSAGSNLASNSKRFTEPHSKQTRRAHGRARLIPPPPSAIPESQFVQNFFTWALVRSPFSNETTYWHDQLRVAHANSQTALKLAAIELGRTLFESAEYAARNRDNHWYVLFTLNRGWRSDCPQ